jgi:hypothetical protein
MLCNVKLIIYSIRMLCAEQLPLVPQIVMVVVVNIYLQCDGASLVCWDYLAGNLPIWACIIHMYSSNTLRTQQEIDNADRKHIAADRLH